jgi:hypothetical protein
MRSWVSVRSAAGPTSSFATHRQSTLTRTRTLRQTWSLIQILTLNPTFSKVCTVLYLIQHHPDYTSGKRLPHELQEATLRTHPDINMKSQWLLDTLGTGAIGAKQAPVSVPKPKEKKDEWEVEDW